MTAFHLKTNHLLSYIPCFNKFEHVMAGAPVQRGTGTGTGALYWGGAVALMPCTGSTDPVERMTDRRH